MRPSTPRDVSFALTAGMLLSTGAHAKDTSCDAERADLAIAEENLIHCLQEDPECFGERETLKSAKARVEECDGRVGFEAELAKSPVESAYELGWQTGGRASVDSWERGAFWAGCLGGPPGCVVATGAAAATHETPSFMTVPEGMSENDRRDFERGFADRLRQKRVEASARKGTQGVLGLLWIPLGIAAIAAGECALDDCPSIGLQFPSGRAFRIDGQAVLPKIVSFAPPGKARQTGNAGAAWLEAARSEAASVPAFRRLAEELAILDAPATLVARARLAARQEARHAALSFHAAASLTGKEYLSMPLPRPARWISRSPEALVTVAREAWVDGCLSEGTAALVTERASRDSRARWAQEVNGVLAREEAEHAELAWDVLEWCWRNADPAAAAVIENLAVEAPEDALADQDDDERHWFGQPTRAGWTAARDAVRTQSRRRLRNLTARRRPR